MQTRKRKVDDHKMLDQTCIIYTCLSSTLEPKNIKEAIRNELYVVAMLKELEEFARNEVWDMVRTSRDVNINGTKQIFTNNTDEKGNITPNKVRLIAQGYTKVESIDFDETFAPDASL